jgi:polysaccharide deacetylase family protein (PEP-CTERM system associated)
MNGKVMLNAMTVDVEDYFQVAAFDEVIDPKNWDQYDIRVEKTTHQLLDLFEEKGVKSTFFTLGWVAERCPSIVKRIVQDGHEIASHGYGHQKATRMTADAFFADIDKAKKILEDQAGVEVKGYRAPSFSIMEDNVWAFDELKKAGYLYSSSTYAIKHDHYGTPNWPNQPHQFENGLWEFPQATVDVLGKRMPAGGGGFFRLQPYLMSKTMIKRFHKQKNHPYIFYFHPWEIDPEQPSVPGAALKSKMRHYVNLSKMYGKVSSLSDDFVWDTIANTHSQYLLGAKNERPNI